MPASSSGYTETRHQGCGLATWLTFPDWIVIEIELPHVVQRMKESELLQIIDRFNGVVAGDDEFTARVLEKSRKLKVISKWGVGVDAIDLEHAKRLGIRTYNTPDVFSDEVADVVMGYIILLARLLHKIDQSVRSGGWVRIQGVSLRGKTLGVIGIGNIGRNVTRRAVAAGMCVVGYDNAPISASFLEETRLHPIELEELLHTADFISLNCNLSLSNRYMLGPREFAFMRTGTYIVNTARGPLIDEAALFLALREGRIAGAALDVFEEEPLPLSSPLRQLDNCIFGTHNSSNTVEAVERVNKKAVSNLLDGLESASPGGR